MRVSAKTDIGRTRAENQDNYHAGVLPDGTTWALVCDGMGGGYNGRMAAVLAADRIEETLASQLGADTPTEQVEDVLRRAVDDANAKVYAQTLSEGQVMGTTVVCAVVRGKELHLMHVGDSRVYLYDADGMRQLTRDHSLVQELVEQGLLRAEDAAHHPDKNIITRVLGAEPEVEADYLQCELQPGAMLLLCSDGLTNLVADEQIARRLQETDFYAAAGALVGDALAAGGNDNITVVLMQMEEGEADG